MDTHRLTIWTLVLSAGMSAGGAMAWEPAFGPLMTPWADAVSPTQAWPEYPRPQMVRPEWTNLNGLWSYAIRPKADPRPAEWDGDILVPFAVESALSGVMKPLRPDQRLWYRRRFEPPPHAGGRLLLHLGAVDWECSVWVNGHEVGRHTGGFDPFTFDITEHVQSSENELVISVWDPTDEGYQPRGKQVLKPGGIMYTAVSGIWQTAWLEPVPERYIRSLKLVPDIDRDVLAVTVEAAAGMAVRMQVRTNGTSVAGADGRAGTPVEIAIAEPILWSPDHPHLYDLEVALIDGHGTVDTVMSYFGMRKIDVQPDDRGINRLFLNNDPLFQYGPLDQGWWPDGLYTPATDEALKYDIEMTKTFGMNMARKHVKVEWPRWYTWCDRLGLLVWQDMPAGDSGRSDESKTTFRSELRAMVDALRNHPSIVMWVPYNEGWGQHDTAETVEWLQAYDPTRPVNEASGWHDKGSGRVSDMHMYPGPGMRPVEESRVSVLGEFGGLGMPVHGHSWQDEQNWGYVSFDDAEQLTAAYVGLLTAMRPLVGRGLAAAVYTQTSDVEIEVNGIMTYDRKRVKMNLDHIAAAARKLYGPAPDLQTLVSTSRAEPQTWQYTTESPPSDWATPEFDDASWTSGLGGFGTEGTPGAVVGTPWNSPDIWARRSFSLEEVPPDGDLLLEVHHDEDAEVYLNGRKIKTFSGYVGDYVPAALDAVAADVLRAGENTLAVHCHQTGGGQFIDVGLVVLLEPDGQATRP